MRKTGGRKRSVTPPNALDTGGDSGAACSISRQVRKSVTGRSMLKRIVDVVYTNALLDIFSYRRDKEFIFGTVFDFKSNETVLVVCSPEVYNMVYYFERSNVILGGRIVLVSTALNEYNYAVQRYDHLILLNVDPFRLDSTVDTRTADVQTRFRAMFNAFLVGNTWISRRDKGQCTGSAAADERGCFYTSNVHLVYNLMTIGEKEIELYIDATRVHVECCLRAPIIGTCDAATVNDEMLRFCNNRVDCVGIDGSYSVAGTIGSELVTATERYLRPDALVTLETGAAATGAPTNTFADYARFKAFYYSYVRGKTNKWGLVTEGGAFWTYIRRMNVCLRDEMKSVFRVLQRYVVLSILYSPTERGGGTNVEYGQSPGIVSVDEINESTEMTEARVMLQRIYDSCPAVLNAVNIRDVIGSRTGVRNLISQTIRHSVPLSSRYVVHDAFNESANRDYFVDSFKLYDTTTFPVGGNIMDPKTLTNLTIEGLGVGNVYTAHHTCGNAVSQIGYNSLFNNLLFPRS